MGLKMAAASATAALFMGGGAPSASAASPPDKGNCLSSFANGGSLGGDVSGDPGGAVTDGRELGGYLHEAHGRC